MSDTSTDSTAESGGEMLLAGPLTVVGHLVRVRTSGNRPSALRTIDVGGVAVFSNRPVAVDEACMTAIRTVKCLLWNRRVSERVGRGQRGSKYGLQADNLRVSLFSEASIPKPSQAGGSA
ncbi:hypothetical protein KY092_11450 [Natronomonas gomsonensis]|uniref:hypothetical protein n=1 Tax=Natronomonas gomsonensis TaxID=1046043 RepID=UPI0020CA7E02|nr:hypothetical protein [Natronomonas gomsonensis]MCY4731170.1 hypothetical protein [Natronomonas gomsonensis]